MQDASKIFSLARAIGGYTGRTTAGGSPGAPCFDDRWRLVGLHVDDAKGDRVVLTSQIALELQESESRANLLTHALALRDRDTPSDRPIDTAHNGDVKFRTADTDIRSEATRAAALGDT